MRFRFDLRCRFVCRVVAVRFTREFTGACDLDRRCWGWALGGLWAEPLDKCSGPLAAVFLVQATVRTSIARAKEEKEDAAGCPELLPMLPGYPAVGTALNVAVSVATAHTVAVAAGRGAAVVAAQ